MVKGSTAQFRFSLPCEFSELQTAKITFWQDGYNGPSKERPLPIQKIKEQCSELAPKELGVTLSREETLRFSELRKAYVQFQATLMDGTSVVTQQRDIAVYPIYDDSILGDTIIPTPDYDGYIVLDGMPIA